MLWLESEVDLHYSGDYEPNNPILSPVFADIDNFPHTLIQVCSSELLYNDAIEFSNKLTSWGGWEGVSEFPNKLTRGGR